MNWILSLVLWIDFLISSSHEVCYVLLSSWTSCWWEHVSKSLCKNQLARSKQLTCLVFGDLLAIIKFQNDSNFFEDNILLLHCCCFFLSCFETFFCQDSKICQKENTWTLNHLILTKIWVNEECKIWDIRHRRERRTFSSYVNFLRVGGILHPI